MPRMNPIRWILFLAAIFLGTSYAMLAADRYSVSSGNWNAGTTWSAVSGGAPGASAPLAGDVVYIESNHSITVASDAACSAIIFSENGAILSINAAVSLDVSGAVTLYKQSTSITQCTITGSGILSCNSVEVGTEENTPTGFFGVYLHTMQISVANMNISGDLNINSYFANFFTLVNGIFNHESGTLTIGGQIRGTYQRNINSCTFSMAAGSASGTLNLTGARSH